jgi:hypothetical protein
MYPWVTHTHTHLGGECPHKCSYCYVKDMSSKPSVAAKYTGPLRLIEKEFAVNYGSGKVIFMEHCNDVFADDAMRFVGRILCHTARYPDNQYVWQTKNPSGYRRWCLPRDSLFGCTIETNRYIDCSLAPSPEQRAGPMIWLRQTFSRTFITVEPIMDFDLESFGGLLLDIRPNFVNIGADSKGHNLPEPSAEKILSLIANLKAHDIHVRQKPNLQRLLNPPAPRSAAKEAMPS